VGRNPADDKFNVHIISQENKECSFTFLPFNDLVMTNAHVNLPLLLLKKSTK